VAQNTPTAPEEPTPLTQASVQPPTAERINHWIENLNHDEFTVRKSAAEQLLAAGTAAREPLAKLIDGPEPESRAAARRLVALIDRTDFQRRLEAFAADKDSRLGLSLPGWERFRERVGSDSAARALFVELQRHESAMLAAVFAASPQPLDDHWERRLARLVQWQGAVGLGNQVPPLGSCATMLFLGSVSEMEVSDQGAFLVEGLIQRPPIRESLQGGQHQNAVRRLVVGWILHCPNQNEEILKHRLYMASLNQLQEVVPWALSVAHGEQNYARLQPVTRAMAILLIGQLGRKEHIQKLESLIGDKTVCTIAGPAQPNTNVQIRDVALVVMLHLSGQRPADYGYVHARIQPQQMFQLQTYAVENEEQRAAAIDKWHAWREEQSSKSRAESQQPEADDTPN
jgi:hypothetical protein